jgi:hypothetical protein
VVSEGKGKRNWVGKAKCTSLLGVIAAVLDAG